MSAADRTLGAAALLFALVVSPAASAAEPKLPRDGWVSWQVAATEDAPAWCCFSGWENGNGTRTACKLDGKSNGYGSNRENDTTDAVKVYARVTGGRVDRVQALAAACPVETRTPIQALGDVTQDDSARWLVAQVKQSGSDAVTRQPLGESALAALAVHRGDVARDALADFARNDARVETRKWAVFWLAQSGAPQAESVLGAAARKDPDEGVRAQAIFALSQLPDERAARALIATAEDRSLAQEQRRKAVFWLAQSDSNAALAYLDKVLAGNASR